LARLRAAWQGQGYACAIAYTDSRNFCHLGIVCDMGAR
jgi:hypothetical protein